MFNFENKFHVKIRLKSDDDFLEDMKYLLNESVCTRWGWEKAEFDYEGEDYQKILTFSEYVDKDKDKDEYFVIMRLIEMLVNGEESVSKDSYIYVYDEVRQVIVAYENKRLNYIPVFRPRGVMILVETFWKVDFDLEEDIQFTGDETDNGFKEKFIKDITELINDRKREIEHERAAAEERYENEISFRNEMSGLCDLWDD